MAKLKYVDWDGLVYYDGLIKDYIDERDSENLKFGGAISFEDLPSPSFQNINYIYRITNDFTTDKYFKEPGWMYTAGTLVQVTNLNDVYLYTIFDEQSVNGGGSAPSVDLTEINNRLDEVESTVSELDETIDSLKSTQEDIQTQLEAVIEEADRSEASIDALNTAIADNSDAIKDLSTAVDNKANAADVYNKAETDAAIAEAVANAQLGGEVDLSEYAKKSDIPDVSNFVTNEYLTQQNYVTEEHLSTTYVTNESLEQKNYVTEEFVTNVTENFITEEVANSTYLTHEVAESTYVTQESAQQTFVTNQDVQNIVQQEVTNQIESTTPDSMNYDTF